MGADGIGDARIGDRRNRGAGFGDRQERAVPGSVGAHAVWPPTEKEEK